MKPTDSSPKSPTPLTGKSVEYPLEGASLVNDLLSHLGASPSNFHKLPPEIKHEKISRLREAFSRPDVREVISNLDGRGLSAERANAIRSLLGLEKWADLASTVALVRTMLSNFGHQDRVSEFAHHAAVGVDANRVRQLLSQKFDVYPARIDTDIQHQSSQYYRAFVELVSNAIDASQLEGRPIGRFGIGFFQILNHLQTEGDRLRVITKSINSGPTIEIEFKQEGGKVLYRIAQTAQQASHGTTIELAAAHFETNSAKDILEKYLRFNQAARVQFNGTAINTPVGDPHALDSKPLVIITAVDGKFIVADGGCGMTISDVFEKLLVPKLSGKSSNASFATLISDASYSAEFTSPDAVTECSIIMQVGGVAIETISTTACNLPKLLVVNLPASTRLDEQRDNIVVDSTIQEAFRNLAGKALESHGTQALQVLNALYEMANRLDERMSGGGSNASLKQLISTALGQASTGYTQISNHADLAIVEFSRERFLRVASLSITDPHPTADYTEHPLWRSASSNPIKLVPAKFSSDSGIRLLRAGNTIFLSDKVQPENFPHFATQAITALCGDVGKFEGSSQIEAWAPPKKLVGLRYIDLGELAHTKWRELGFSSPKSALESASFLDSMPDLEEAFLNEVVPYLPHSALFDAWTIMRTIAQSRANSELKIPNALDELRSLGSCFKNLASDPVILNTLTEIDSPLCILTESFSRMPPQLRNFSRNQERFRHNGEFALADEKYFKFIDLRNPNATLLISAAAEIIYYNRLGRSLIADIVFEGGNWFRESFDEAKTRNPIKEDEVPTRVRRIMDDLSKSEGDPFLSLSWNQGDISQAASAMLRPTHFLPPDGRDFHKFHYERFAKRLPFETGDIPLGDADPRTRVTLDNGFVRFTSYSNGMSIVAFEAQDPHQDLLSNNFRQLTPSKVNAIRVVLDDHEAVRKFGDRRANIIYLGMQFRHLSDEAFEALSPIFSERRFVDPRVFDKALEPVLLSIGSLPWRERKSLLRILNSALPLDPQKAVPLAGKIRDYFVDQLLDEGPYKQGDFLIALGTIIPALSLGLSHNSGFELLRYSLPIEEQLIPEAIRTFYLYVTMSDDKLATISGEKHNHIADGTTFLLSQLIHWKRNRETFARAFSGDHIELASNVRETSQSADTASISREISHATNFRTSEPLRLFLRELTQNCLDAMAEGQLSPDDRVVDVRVETQGLSQVAIIVTDKVGMSTDRLFNYFLVPSATTKEGGEMRGFFGEGVFTVFRDAHKVRVQTGCGDGHAWVLELTPIRADGIVIDIEMILKHEAGSELRGTSINVFEACKNPFVRGAQIRDELLTLVSNVEEAEGRIMLQGHQINRTPLKLGNEQVPELGEVALVGSAKNTLTHRGMFVCPLPDELLGGLPTVVRSAIEKFGGYSIDLPVAVKLTRSRKDFVNRDFVIATLKPVVTRLLVSHYLKGVRDGLENGRDVFPFDDVPYDFFYVDAYAYVPSSRARDFSERLIAGNTSGLVANELSREEGFFVLLELPVFKVGEDYLSLQALRLRSRDKRPPFDSPEQIATLPARVRKLEEYKLSISSKPKNEKLEELNEVLEFIHEDDSLENILNVAPPAIAHSIREHTPALERIRSLTSRLYEALDAERGGTTRVSFYYADDRSSAHAFRWPKMVSWNLKYLLEDAARQSNSILHRLAAVGPIDETTAWDGFVRVMAHEYAHLLEHVAPQVTHDRSFQKLEGQVALAIIELGGDVLREAMSGYQG